MRICDNHNDFLTAFKTIKKQKEYINSIPTNNHICCVIWTSELKSPVRYIKKIYNAFFKKHNNENLLLCIEDLGFINNKNFNVLIKMLIDIKPFYCGLVWNNNNSLGGGAFGKKGLTKLGIKVIKELEKNNILIDTAHMNKKTFNQFKKITTLPIYNSHSNLTKFKNHKRNLNSSQIKDIIDSNGLICLSFVQTFISNHFIDSSTIAKQIRFFIDNYGIDNLAIGTDFYGTKNLPTDIKNYNDFINLKQSLKNENLTEKEIKKIFYKNFLAFKSKINNRF